MHHIPRMLLMLLALTLLLSTAAYADEQPEVLDPSTAESAAELEQDGTKPADALSPAVAEADGNEDGDASVITIQMTDEAKKHEAEVTQQDGAKALLSEAYFDQLLVQLSTRGEETLPECTVVNELGCVECEGSKVYTLTPESYDKVILYTHGGGWVFEISAEHIAFCDTLATRLHAKVYMPLYPLAPQATSEETYTVIEALYKEILKEGKPVAIAGDSAGGNITLGLMYTIKAEGLQKPEKMILIAPCSDMSMTNEAMEALDQTDPELGLYGCRKCAAIWAGADHLKDPKNSAVYADLTGYPDTMLIQGTNDILCPDNMILFEKLKAAGVDATLVIGEGLWHVFPVDPIPESEEVLGLIEAFFAE